MLPSCLPRSDKLLDLVGNSSSANQGRTTDQQVTETVIEELASTPCTQTPLSKYLSSAGYTGDHDDRQPVNHFLLSSLQAKRVIAHQKAQSAAHATNLSPSYRLSYNVSRLFVALNTPPNDPNTAPFCVLIDQITRHISTLMIDSDSSSLQSPILNTSHLSDSVKPPRLETLSKILAQLQREQATRIGLLLTRLQVTTQSFSRAQRAHDNPELFSALARRSQVLQAKWATPYPLTICQTLAARNYLLIDGQLRTLFPDRSSSTAVKDFVMGSVPDRGGRINAGSQMPEFQDRVDGNNTVHKGKQRHNHGRGGASGKGRRRR